MIRYTLQGGLVYYKCGKLILSNRHVFQGNDAHIPYCAGSGPAAVLEKVGHMGGRLGHSATGSDGTGSRSAKKTAVWLWHRLYRIDPVTDTVSRNNAHIP